MLRSAHGLAAGSLCLFASIYPAMAASPIGKVVAVIGAPSAAGPGGERSLAAGSAVYEDDRIVTGGGNVQIIFTDNTKLVVGPHSTLVIDRYLLRGGKSVRKFSIDVLRGTFRFISGNSRKSAYNITTANSTIKLQGTAFDVAAGGATLIAVYSGKASLCAYGACETVDQYCGVARARDGKVLELKGRAKAQALKGLSYAGGQAMLARPFRVDTSGCRMFRPDFDSGSKLETERGRTQRDRSSNPGANPNPQ